jgi:hypothetical protein
MRSCGTVTLLALVCLASAGEAYAQEPRLHLAMKGGATIEDSEDGRSGSAPAAGVTAALALGTRWRAEAEFWLPGHLQDAAGAPEHRDVLFSGSVVRLLGAGRVRPYLQAGMTIARTEDALTLCSASRLPPGGTTPVRAIVSCDEPDVTERVRETHIGRYGYLLLGGGVDIPINRRIAVVADVRFSVAPASMLIRPGIGLSVGF